jgi:tetratricopeptide (TPR) repeat protein
MFVDYYEQALEITREMEDSDGELSVVWVLCHFYEQMGDYARAVELLESPIEFLRKSNHRDADRYAAYLDQLRAKQSGRVSDQGNSAMEQADLE